METPGVSRTDRVRSRRVLAAAAAAAVVTSFGPAAEAAAFNDPACRPAPGKSPVVLVHGRGGNVDEMTAIRGALVANGYCVFGKNYGQERPGRPYGLARLDVSGEEIKRFIEGVLQSTGAPQVDVIGHSAGTGVLDNYVLRRGGAAQVRRLVSFGGLHHPYAHVGLARVIDANLFLPNTIRAVQDLVPPFTSNVGYKDVAAAALGVASSVGANLSEADRELVESGFVADLFDPKYWNELHGGLSEEAGKFVAVNGRSLPTKDAAPNVCYTNIVGVADLVTGTNAGFQDEGPNVDNFVLPTAADHVQMISDPVALAKMVSALDAPCTVGANGTGISGESGAADGESDDGAATAEGDRGDALGARGRRSYDVANAGCSAASGPSSSLGSLFCVAASLALATTRRRRTAREDRR